MRNLILASTSPARILLLKNAGVHISARAPLLDEEAELQSDALPPMQVAMHLAKAKALSLGSENGNWILAADQTLICDGQLFRKPRDRADAREQLLKLRGKTHELHSAVALAVDNAIIWTNIGIAQMTMRQFSCEFLETYLDSEGADLLGCVGCYRIEGKGIQLFQDIKGGHDTVIGLPLLPLLEFLRKNGMMAA